MTWCRVIASKVTGPTNRAAGWGITATPSGPRFCSPGAPPPALWAQRPPVTPSAPRLIVLLVAAGRGSRLDLLARPGDPLALGDGGFFVFADVDAGRRSGEQLPRPGPR